MAISLSPKKNQSTNSWSLRDWLSLAGVISLAIALRVCFCTGFLGSDDTHYVKQAIAIANGEWIVSDYVGDLRYGVNLPMAFFVKIIGASQFSAGAWSFICSIGEIALVFYFGRREWGLREATFAALAIALVPRHILQAGMFMADPPLAFFISLSFVAFFIAEQSRSILAYVAAGLVCGSVFWIKEMVVIYAGVFVLYALVIREFKWQWFWCMLGAMVMVASNCLLLWVITGNPWHIFDSTYDIVGKFRVSSWTDNSAFGYFKHLFFNGTAMGFMPYFALVGGLLWVRDWCRKTDNLATRYVVIWAGGLLCIFSFTIISISPLKFIAKQSNYMLIFTAPLCLLAGLFLARIKGVWLTLALASMLIPSIVLSAMGLRSIQVFTANSIAAYHFAVSKPESVVYGGTNAYRIAEVLAKLQFGHDAENPLKPLAELFGTDAKYSTGEGEFPAYVIYDPQTVKMDKIAAINQQSNRVVIMNGVDDLPRCWKKLEKLKLQPVIGEELINRLNIDTKRLPVFFNKRLELYMANPLAPVPAAYVYGIPKHCVSIVPLNSTN